MIRRTLHTSFLDDLDSTVIIVGTCCSFLNCTNPFWDYPISGFILTRTHNLSWVINPTSDLGNSSWTLARELLSLRPSSPRGSGVHNRSSQSTSVGNDDLTLSSLGKSHELWALIQSVFLASFIGRLRENRTRRNALQLRFVR